jgi:hypothetical protein
MKLLFILIVLLSFAASAADLYRTFFIVCEHTGTTITEIDSVTNDTTEQVTLRGIACGRDDDQMKAQLNHIWAEMKAEDVDSADVYIFLGTIESDSQTDCEGIQPTQLTLTNLSSGMRAAYYNFGGK